MDQQETTEDRIDRTDTVLPLAEQRLADFMAITDEWLWETDRDHRFVYFSGNHVNFVAGGEAEIQRRLLGRTRWEVAGGDPDRDPKWAEHRADLMAHRPFRNLRTENRGENGQIRYLRISGNPIFAPDGTFLGYRGVGANETAAIEAERKRASAEALLHDAISSISDGFALFDREDRLVLCNARYRALFPASLGNRETGETFATLLRRGIANGEYPDAIGCEDIWFDERLAQHRQPGSGVEYQIADGRWLLASERRMRNGGIAGLYVDITALKHTEAAWRRSEERYALAFEAADEGLWDWDLVSGSVFRTRRMLAMIGHDPDEAQGSGQTWLDILHPEDAERYRRDFVRHLKGETDHFECEFRVRGTDGSYRWVYSRGRGIRDRSGRTVRVVGSTRDLTAQKDAEARRRREIEEFQRELEAEICERGRAEETARRTNEQLSAVIGASPYAIFGLDADRRIVIWNRTAETLFGYRTIEVIGREAPVFQGDAAYLRLLDDASAGEFIRGATLNATTRAGVPLTLNLSATALHETDGTLRLIVVTLEDVTRRIQIEEQLQQSQKMEAMGRLTGGIAHDFNNMLGVVVGNLDMVLETEAIASDILEMCGEALDAALLCTDLVSRLMSFSRKRPLQLAPVSLEAKLAGLLPMLRRTIGEDIEVTSLVGDRLWPIATDPAQLETALINLAINARDAMPNGGRLTVTAQNLLSTPDFADRYPGAPVGDYVRIAITDTGGGMTPDVVRHCLEPFFTTKGAAGGTGLGLSMVYGLIKQSQGHLNIDSAVGQGTTIELLFPHVPAAPSIAGPRLGTSEDDRPLVGGSERILVVEDNAALRRTAITTLTNLGYAVSEAENAATALDMLKAGIPVDLVFTDVVMPGRLNGVGLVREIERLYPGIRIVFTSGYTSTPETEAQIAASGHELLAKPYRKAELASLLRGVLDGEAPRHVALSPHEGAAQ